MKIALGSDHAGYDAKQALKTLLEKRGHDVEDCGPAGTESVDYPDYAEAVARTVAAGDCERGILICGTGIGMCIGANKVPGIRAAKCNDPEEARLSREHNNANVLCLGARVIDASVLAESATVFLNTDFAGGRHARRVEKLDALD
jgi:ribose 5-phosphate isomerase B